MLSLISPLRTQAVCARNLNRTLKIIGTVGTSAQIGTPPPWPLILKPQQVAPHVITFGARRMPREPRESSEYRREHVKTMTCGEAVMKLLSAYEVDTVF